jgi:hypothetical protein
MTESMEGVNNILDESVSDDDSIGQLVVGPCQNLEQMTEEPDLTDSLFVGSKRKLMQ